MIIAIDYDGTITRTDTYPHSGEIDPMAIHYINRMRLRGHKVLINTCREGYALREAETALEIRRCMVDGFNINDTDRIKMFRHNSRKIGADIYIEDRDIMSYKRLLKWKNIWRRFVRVEHPMIVCLVGESGSGKTMLAKYVKKKYGIPSIKSYTDRPRRHWFEHGHKFVSTKRFDKIKREDMIAFTVFGDKRYCCIKKDVKPVCIYVIDEDGLRALKDKCSRIYDIVSICIHRNKNRRIEAVGQDRVERDVGRFTIEDKHYDYVIQDSSDSIYYKQHLMDQALANCGALYRKYKL